jgi:hypothetical protein
MQDNQDRETSTDEVQSTREYKKKIPSGYEYLLCLCVVRRADHSCRGDLLSVCAVLDVIKCNNNPLNL